MFVNALLGTAPRNLIPRHFAEKKPKYFVKSFMFFPLNTSYLTAFFSEKTEGDGL